MEYNIRNAEASDISQLAEIENQCFSVPWTEEQLSHYLPDKMHMLILADSGEKVLGYVGLMYVIDEGYISNVAVRPEARRKGIADALINELIAKANREELSFVTLEVRAGNEAAKALYKKHGFIEVGRSKNHYSLPTEDAIFMTRYLK